MQSYESLISFGNLYDAWCVYRSGKANKKSAQIFAHRLEDNLFKIHESLKSGTWQPQPYRRFIIHDPKMRIIHTAPVADRVVHTVAARYLRDVYQPRFIAHSFACQDDRGTHAALRAVRRMVRRESRNFTRTCRYLKLDIQKFFEHIDHGILMEILTRTITDLRILRLMRSIIESYDSGEVGVGLPLGNFTSQWFANIYLHELDHYVKHVLKINHYARYADDVVIISRNEEMLVDSLPKIDVFVRTQLHLRLHPDKIVLRKLSQGLDWVGYTVRPRYAVLKHATAHRMRRRVQDRQMDFAKKTVSPGQYAASLSSYDGQLTHCNGNFLKDFNTYQCILYDYTGAFY